ncbi:MAG: hypothetical protein H7246_01800 [Phycisphaerae bacterium]|nr:hypothetical protein [Saprospiraceae bacterium]
MNDAWINPKIIIGPIATGDYYYPRPQIEANLWEETRKGSHVLLAAPRRVGKTSVMLAMQQNCPADTRCVFKNIESVKSETEFYQSFFDLLVRCLDKFGKGMSWLNGFFKGIHIEEITLEGVKFGEKKALNYAEEIESLLPKIAEQKLKIVILLDELPEVLNGLYKSNRSNEASAILSRLRQWRQNPDIRQHFSLVLAGSVGLHHIVKIIEGRTSVINDFGIVPFEALTPVQAADYIAWATKDASVQYDQILLQHLLSKINYFIPYFLSLMLNEINVAARKNNAPNISKQSIDAAFDTIVKNSDHFKDWKNRLTEYFSAEDAGFMNETLIYIAHKDSINPRQLYDLAFRHSKKDAYMELVRGLEHDGYITELNGDFVFVSPFLQAFWKADNPFYDHA